VDKRREVCEWEGECVWKEKTKKHVSKDPSEAAMKNYFALLVLATLPLHAAYVPPPEGAIGRFLAGSVRTASTCLLHTRDSTTAGFCTLYVSLKKRQRYICVED
jgi:hypothetical protein